MDTSTQPPTYRDIYEDKYGYLTGDFVTLNRMVTRPHDPDAIGIMIGSTDPGTFDVLIEGALCKVRWNEIKPIGFRSTKQKSRNKNYDEC